MAWFRKSGFAACRACKNYYCAFLADRLARKRGTLNFIKDFGPYIVLISITALLILKRA